MEESKIIEMIRNTFSNEVLADEDVDIVIDEIIKNNFKSETEIMNYLKWLKNEMSKRIIDDSEFDEE